jgi:hypothetical protein
VCQFSFKVEEIRSLSNKFSPYSSFDELPEYAKGAEICMGVVDMDLPPPKFMVFPPNN